MKDREIKYDNEREEKLKKKNLVNGVINHYPQTAKTIEDIDSRYDNNEVYLK